MRAASSGSTSKSGISANGEYVAGDGGTSGAAADDAVASGSTSGGSAVGGSATGAVGGSATGVVDGSTTGAVDGSTTGSGGGVAGRELGGDAGKDGAASPSGMILAGSTTSSFGWHPGHVVGEMSIGMAPYGLRHGSMSPALSCLSTSFLRAARSSGVRRRRIALGGLTPGLTLIAIFCKKAADGAVANGSTSGGSAVGGSATGAVGGSTTGSGGGVGERELGGDAGKDGAASPSGMISACSTTSSFGWHPGHGQLQPHCDVSLHTWLRPSGPRTSQMHRRPAALACVHPQVESVSGGDGGGEGTTHSQLSEKGLVKAILVTTIATAITAALGVRENPTNGATPTSWLETGPSPSCSKSCSGA